jgi:hypothetical protein
MIVYCRLPTANWASTPTRGRRQKTWHSEIGNRQLAIDND